VVAVSSIGQSKTANALMGAQPLWDVSERLLEAA
jgi:hypothetical protein